MKLFDLHCDTVYKLEKNGLPFENEKTHITFSKTQTYDVYEQVFACWSRNASTNEENWDAFFRMKQAYEKEILPHKSESFIPHFAIEGGKLLDGKLERLTEIKNAGVEMMTLIWKGDCCIGGGHDTNNGLTPFGKEVVKEMIRLGITPDVSHCSDKTIYDTLLISHDCGGSPVIATHSNSRKVREHTRNLTDEEFSLIKESCGIVGISLCREHLDETEKADIASVIRHIEHYMSLGGEKTVCFGCDLDGIKSLPDGISGLCELYKIADELQKLGYPQKIIDGIFYDNAKDFFTKRKI